MSQQSKVPEKKGENFRKAHKKCRRHRGMRSFFRPSLIVCYLNFDGIVNTNNDRSSKRCRKSFRWPEGRGHRNPVRNTVAIEYSQH